jgi:hypothetical protein
VSGRRLVGAMRGAPCVRKSSVHPLCRAGCPWVTKPRRRGAGENREKQRVEAAGCAPRGGHSGTLARRGTACNWRGPLVRIRSSSWLGRVVPVTPAAAPPRGAGCSNRPRRRCARAAAPWTHRARPLAARTCRLVKRKVAYEPVSSGVVRGRRRGVRSYDLPRGAPWILPPGAQTAGGQNATPAQPAPNPLLPVSVFYTHN